MKRRNTRVILLGAALAVGGSTLHAQEGGRSGERDLGFTWWNDLPALIEKGNEAYFEERLEEAEDAYLGAQLQAPDAPETAFNRGLVQGRRGNYSEAIDAFERALQRAGEDAGLRAKANYNLGLMHWNRAFEAIMEEEDYETSLDEALQSLDRFEDALRYEPQNDAALENRRQVQHFLEMFATPPEPEPDEPEPDDGDDGGQPQQMPMPDMNGDDEEDASPDEGDQEEGEQEQPAEGDPFEDESDETEGEGEPEPGEDTPADADPDDGDPMQTDPAPGDDEPLEQPAELTPEEALELLNLLGERQDLVLRQGRTGATREEPEKPW